MIQLLILYLISSVTSTTLTRIAVNDTEARCIDGSPYYYYISVGTASSRYYIYHEGGGWCYDINECTQRANTPLGSSKTWATTSDMGDGMSRDPQVNSLMYDWTLVYLPYCDGGSFTGDAVNSSPMLYFRGLRIREAVVASLKAYYAFDSATDLIIGGCSAGGLATYLHVDWYASQVPKAKAGGLPDSGFFLDGNYSRDGIPDYEANMKNLYNFMNSQAGIHSPCIAKLGYQCFFAYHILPFISTPILVQNSAYDATMEDGECGHSGIIFNWNNPASVNDCGNYISGLMKTLLVPPSAVFLDSCKHHCGEWDALHIDQMSSTDVLKVWYTQGSNALPNKGFMDQNQPYPCNLCCSSMGLIN